MWEHYRPVTEDEERMLIEKVREQIPELLDDTRMFYVVNNKYIKIEYGKKILIYDLNKNIFKHGSSVFSRRIEINDRRRYFAISLNTAMNDGYPLSVDWLSNATGISKRTINNYLNAKTLPNKENLQRLSKALNVPIKGLIG